MQNLPVSKRRLSVAILARNAAEEISETLVSIRNFADEIIVLDTGSTDDTREIAQQLGATVHQRPWGESFAGARNSALTFVSGDFVLWLDAGETLSRESATLLREFVDQHADLSTAYALRIALPAVSTAAAGEQIAKVRLHPNRRGITWQGLVRENLDRSLFAFGMRCEGLPVTIHRGERDHDCTRRQERARRNLGLIDLQIAKEGLSANLSNALGEAWQTLGSHEAAARHYQMAKDLAEPNSREQLEAYYGLLACLDFMETLPAELADGPVQKISAVAGATSPAPATASAELDRKNSRESQTAICLEALEIFPLDAQLLVALGGYLQALGRVELAQRAYDVAFRHGQTVAEIWHLPDIREIAAACETLSLWNSRQEGEALAAISDAWQSLPQSVRLGQLALELHVNSGNIADALAIAQNLPQDFPCREVVPAAVEGAILAISGNWKNGRESLEAAFAAGCRQKWVLRWYAKTLLALSDLPALETALVAWEAVEPKNRELHLLREKLASQSIRHPALPALAQTRIDPAQTLSPPKAKPAGTSAPLAGWIRNTSAKEPRP